MKVSPVFGVVILGLVVALAGCASDSAGAESSATPKVAESSTSGAPSSTAGSSNVNSTASPAGATTATSPAPNAPAANPSRAFQLADLTHAPVKVNGKTVDAWVMDTEMKRQEGMMFLTDQEVRDDQGMIFVFRDPQINDGKHGFWMHNTILPLDIVYIAADKKVLNIQNGKPHDDTSLPPAATYRYVLEVKHGQAAKLGIKPGVAIELPAGLTAPE